MISKSSQKSNGWLLFVLAVGAVSIQWVSHIGSGVVWPIAGFLWPALGILGYALVLYPRVEAENSDHYSIEKSALQSGIQYRRTAFVVIAVVVAALNWLFVNGKL